MRALKNTLASILLLAAATLPSVALAAEEVALAPLNDRITMLFGRLHPTLVHFPICLLIVTAIIETAATLRKQKQVSYVGLVTLSWGAAASVVATAAGLANAAYQDFFGEAADFLELHLWGGIVVTVVALVGSLIGLRLNRDNRRPYRSRIITAIIAVSSYRTLAILNALLMSASAHFGGLLVHGADYFQEPLTLSAAGTNEGSETSEQRAARASIRRTALAANKSSAVVIPPPSRRKINFEKDIHPILQESCAKCHDGGKSKGDYRIDDRDLFIKGGKTGPAAVVGDSEASYVVKLISGVEPKKVMPSKGRLLNQEEIGLIRAWIDQGLTWGASQTRSSLTAKKPTTPRRPELPATTTTESHNPIDQIVSNYLQEKGSAGLAKLHTVVSDQLYIKRVYHDLHGTTPSQSEIARFEANSSPDKRRELIRTLLKDREAFASHWLTWWNDMLRNDYSGPGFLHGGRQDNSQWIYAAVYNNTPYDKFVSRLIAPRPNSSAFINGVKWWQAGNVNANEEIGMQAAQNVGQVFMGINLKCASCHNSFTDEWKLRETYAFANAFSEKQLGVHECNVPTGEAMSPAFLFPELGEIKGGTLPARRRKVASLVTSTQNGRFARTFVNRVWQRLFGAGIIEPLDEMDQPAWSDDLLDWLANEFVAQSHDIDKLLELVMTSHTYQLPAVNAPEKIAKNFVFKGPLVRRKNAEELLDGISHAFTIAPSTLSSDVERALAVSLFNPNLPKTGALEKEKLLFRSGEVAPNSNPVPFSVTLQNDESVWLVVLRRFEKTSALDKQRQQFEQVALQDQGLPELTTSSSQSERDRRSQRVKGLKQNALKEESDENYRATFEGLRFTVDSRSLTLGEVDKNPQVFFERPIETATVSLSKTGSNPEGSLPLLGKDFIKTQAFTAIRVNLHGIAASKLSGRVLATSPSKEEESTHKVEFLILRDLEVRSVFLEANPTLLTLGRPRREQIMTTRKNAATTMQVLELSTGEGLSDLVKQAAIVSLGRTAQGKVQTSAPLKVVAAASFGRLLGREPRKEELKTFAEAFGQTLDQKETEDLIWSITMLPEFQLIT